MSLDLFSSNIDDAVGYAGRVSAPELPSTFSDNFDDAFAKGRLVSQSISGNLRKSRALSDYMDEVQAKAGEPLQLAETATIEEMNARVRTLKAARPDLDVSELTDEEIQRRADEIGVRQLADSQALDRRERTTGGTIGAMLGTAGAAVTDPVNMVAFPLAAPESLGILGTALAWGAIGAGSQTAIEVLNAPAMERIQPGYATSGEPLQNIAEAGLAGGVLGGGLKGLSNLWTKAKTGNWPRTIRDAGNVVESEAQIASTNPMPGVEGEAAHRTALNKAIDDLANGRPVDVDSIVPAEQFAARDAAVEPVIAARDASNSAAAAVRAVDEPKIRAEIHQYFNDERGEFVPSAEAQALIDRMPAEIKQAGFDVIGLGKGIQEAGDLLDDEIVAKMRAELRPKAEAAAKQIDDWLKENAGQKSAPQLQLPFERTSLQAQAELSAADLTKGVQDIARMAGHDMPAEDAAKIAARVAQLNDPDKARALLDEVFVRPQTIADTLPAVDKPVKSAADKASPDAVASLRDELTPAKIEEARVNPDMEETISRDLDKLMLERPDLEVPTGVTVDADGRTVSTTRKIESVINEADSRLAAAKEIEGCVGPYPSEAA